ncbi:MAG: peptide methionine sulfoxide reductase [Rhodospirillales bacterium]|jgi:peptide-methionine (S)-S-oxide reductase|nr:peptide methionine sulfoxide reductase [Rhodospirillales bacterium]MDB5383905.1 peptide methionine sulfoxide reductase [Rhodospirillales bacterium]
MSGRRGILALFGIAGISSCAEAQGPQLDGTGALAAPAAGKAAAVFAGGCFWCMEPPFDALPGVLATTSGYAGGSALRPTYQQVTAGGTGHVEAVHILFDPARVSYARLLSVFWRNVDPLDAGGQFCDRGQSYTTAIFAQDADQRRDAEASAIEIQARLGRAPATRIRDAAPFWPAEDYHQDYYLKNPVRYRFYRFNCGRDARLRAVWGEGW